MFTEKELGCLDSGYFTVTRADAYDVTVISRNTGHVWYFHNSEWPRPGTCVIFHQHKGSYPYHLHGRRNSLRQSVRSIRGHDAFQLNGRRDSGR